MGTTLSPFRYIAFARYLLQRWLDHPHVSSWKGKGKAVNPTHYRTNRHLPGRGPVVRSMSAESGRSLPISHPDLQHPIAGPSEYRRPLVPDPNLPPEPNDIYRLMNDERLMIPGALKPPREVVVLCHGLYGFSTATPIPLFPSLKLHYWASVLEVLRDRMGVKVVVVGVKGTGSIEERAQQMHEFLRERLPRGTGVNFVAHSMGGLDCRHLISTIKPDTYTPLSLTTIGTPHRGSPFMDWCSANIGLGNITAAAAAAAIETAKNVPFSLKTPLLSRALDIKKSEESSSSSISAFTSGLTSYLLNIFDSPAYSNLTTAFLRDFNPKTPDSSSVKYTSVAGRIAKMSVLHPLWFPKLVLDAAGEKGYPAPEKPYEGNDGLVNVSSAKWGEFLGAVDDCHHWDLRGEGGLWPNGGSIGDKKPEGKPDESMPGGWDWQGGVQEHLGLDPAATSKDLKAQQEKGKAGTSDKEGNDNNSSTWDVAQVGQVLDWVTDYLPGEKSTEVGKKQLADAKREKEKETRAKEGGRGKDGDKEKEKDKKQKFDLARFYGGLMIKLREDGF
ncbi:Alpha/Beta hydrolase protein [Naematelia encephala]|uniref:Alpha/Beta hydrolase protein n=1 Tax=Naematelia encephala TaxID=71784 RepID=A0A1Y2BJP1_9TREE|nr:Alpha/Beta hydrolase protein [Naematelia encephala]